MRASLIWFSLLLQTFAGASTNKQEHGKTNTNPNSDLAAHSFPPEGRQPAAELVEAALAELQKLPPPKRSTGSSTSIFTTIFKLILSTVPSAPVVAPTSSSGRSLAAPLLSAVELLERAAFQNNSDAHYLLADLNFYGNFSYPRNLRKAYAHYHQLASAEGNTTAQYMLGLYHSTGIGNVVPRDQAKALLYYTFAAAKGDHRAEMATGYRHLSGIGTTKSCDTGAKHYRRVAQKVIEWYHSGPPGGMSWISHGWRISDDDGGIYGEGASASSAGMNAWKPPVNSEGNAAISDRIEYLDLLSQKGDSKASFKLGLIYYEGQRELEKNFNLARKYFFLVALRYWRRDGRLLDNFKPGIEKSASSAAGYLGRLYLRGDGVDQNFDKAKIWFERGVALGEATSQFGLGLMLMNGYGTKKNMRKAVELFRVSAEQDYAPAHVQMGKLHLDQGAPEDLRTASHHFELAARYGNIEAFYYLAEMLFHGVGREKLCTQALLYYKNVVEKAEPLVSSWADANQAYQSGEYETAFLEYLMAAEQGYEKAQTNVAHMLDKKQSMLPVPRVLETSLKKEIASEGLLANPELALIYWTRSSRQSNIDALVKVGDYYYYGIGTEPDVNKALACYTGASDHSQSAQALFNLGWMHENGIGLKQDFHLAKRYYDSALEVNIEAYLPVSLSLLKLRIRSAWNTFTNGEVHSIQDEPKPKRDRSLSEWIANFLDADGLEYDDLSLVEGDYDNDGDSDGAFFDEEGLLESILIVGITMSLVFLIWWRNRIQQGGGNNRNQGQDQHQDVAPGQQPQPQPQPNNGGNPGELFGAWAANGLGF